MRSLEIAVCGAGPAGLAAALQLKRAGHKVQLFERFEVPRPVGSGLMLQPTGLAVLAQLQLLERMQQLGARIEHIEGRVVPSLRIVLEVHYSALGAGTHGLAVHRAALWGTLHEAVLAQGLTIQGGRPIQRVDRRADRSRLWAGDGALLGEFDLIVDAMGAFSPLTEGLAQRTVLPYGALWTNVPLLEGPWHRNALEQRYQRAHQMVGLLPVGRSALGEPAQAAFFWSLRRDQWEQWREAGLSAWKSQILRMWPELEPLLQTIESPEQMTFARYEHFTLAQPFRAGVVHVGDAAHATSPQLGQGANMALLDTLALTHALAESPDVERALRQYALLRRWHVRVFQLASAMFTPFYQSNGRVLPWIRDWLAAPLARQLFGQKILTRLVTGTLVAPLRGQSHAISITI